MGPVAVLLVAGLSLAFPQYDQHKPGMDHRGAQAMGFDQGKATHTITTTDSGGVIAIDANDAADATTIQQIRTHLQEIAKTFKSGDFSKPRFIHEQTPPGADVMKAKKELIEYSYEETKTGGKVTITSADRDVVQAVHRFLAFQKAEHGTTRN